MWSFGRMVGVLILGWAQFSWALYIPFCRWVYSGADPRNRELVLENRQDTERGINDALTALSGKHVSAAQAQSQEAKHFIDTYLMAGQKDPLIAKYQGPVRRAERAFLEHAKNRELIEALKDLAAREDLTKEAVNATLKEMGLAQTWWNGSPEGLKAFLKKKIEGLEKQNLAFEREIGRNYEAWKAIRMHLRLFLDGDDGVLLPRVKSRAAVEEPALESMVPMSRAAVAVPPAEPGDALKADIKERTAAANEVLKARQKREQELLKLLSLLRKNEDPKIYTDITEFCTNHNYLTNDLRIVLEAADNGLAVAKLELLADRIHRLNKMSELAIQLDAEFGVQPTDFKRLSQRYPPQALRPTVEEMEEIADKSFAARDAKNLHAFFRQSVEVIDGNFLGGNAGAMVPVIGRTLDAIKAPGLRTFVYWLFNGIYEHHVRRKYMPSLLFLLDFEGTAAELRMNVEKFNGSTKDEFLLAMARFPEMHLIWSQVKAEATKNPNHFDLTGRMEEQEKKVKSLGTTSFIDQSSYLRYAIMALFYGGIAYGTNTYVIAPLRKDGSNPADDDDDKDKPVEGAKEVVGYVPGMENEAIHALGVLIAAAYPDSGLRAGQVELAAQTLWDLEQKLSLRPHVPR